MTLGLEPMEGYSRRRAPLRPGPLFGGARIDRMPRDGAIRRGEIVWDQAGRQVPTSVADAAPDAALDLAGRETVVTKKDNDRWIRAPWRACPTQIRAAGVAVSGSLRRAAEHRARGPRTFPTRLAARRVMGPSAIPVRAAVGRCSP